MKKNLLYALVLLTILPGYGQTSTPSYKKNAAEPTNKLKSYSSKVHFDYALKAYENWGQAIDPETLKQNIKYLESFTCKGRGD